MYAVLQVKIDQAIDLPSLQEAVRATRTLTSLDCGLLQRELFGIVAGNLDQDEALAMQRTLAARGVPTELVEQSNLPVLARPLRPSALKIADDGDLISIDLYGREDRFDSSVFVFAAAGHLLRLRNVPRKQMEWVIEPGPRGSVERSVQMVTNDRLENTSEFRLEFFFSREPYRLQWLATDDSHLKANGEILRLRDRDRLSSFLATLANAFPPERVNLGIKKAVAGSELVYPSVRAFEEEIVWSFYQLMRGAA